MLSIVTPVLNGGAFIQGNIESILKLGLPHEHIIVDGGSTDSTLEVLSKYKHLKIIHQKEKTGMYGAIDMAFNQSMGDFICYVNADDKVIPEGFEQMYLKIKNSDIDLIYSDAYFEFPDLKKTRKIKGKLFGKYFLKKGILPFVQPSSIFTRNVYNKVGGLRYMEFKICGDLDLFQRIALLEESKISYLPIISSIFYKYDGSLGNSNAELYLKEKNKLSINEGDKFINRILVYCSTILSYLKKNN